MIWVVFWALGVVAFLVFFFWRNLRWFLRYVLGGVVLIAGVVFQLALADCRGCRDFVDAASGIGRGILIFAVAVLVSDILAMAIYTFRHGESGDESGKVITEDRPLSSVSRGYPLLMGRSKVKILGSKSGFVTMKSLVDGTATFGERLLVFGIITAFLSFSLIWLGMGLMMMNKIWIIAVFIPILPGLFVYYNLRRDWELYQRAKKGFRGHLGQPTMGTPQTPSQGINARLTRREEQNP